MTNVKPAPGRVANESNTQLGVLPRLSNPKLGLYPRLVASLWFGVAALVAVVFYFLLFGGVWQPGTSKLNISSLWLLGAVPVSAAALAGFAIGSRLVDLEARITVAGAAARGIWVALLSYLLLMATYFTLVALVSLLGMTNQSFAGFPSWFVIIFAFGLVFAGWLIVIIGAIAGVLLRKAAASRYLRNDLGKAERVSARTASTWIAAAGALFVLTHLVVILLVMLMGQRDN